MKTYKISLFHFYSKKQAFAGSFFISAIFNVFAAIKKNIVVKENSNSHQKPQKKTKNKTKSSAHAQRTEKSSPWSGPWSGPVQCYKISRFCKY